MIPYKRQLLFLLEKALEGSKMVQKHGKNIKTETCHQCGNARRAELLMINKMVQTVHEGTVQLSSTKAIEQWHI